jgi:hypothetical protein
LTQIRRAGAAGGLASLRQEAIVGKLAVTMANKCEKAATPLGRQLWRL